MRRLTSSAVSMCLVGLLAACGGGGLNSDAQTITVLLVTSPTGDAIKKMTPDFTAKTGVNVKFVEVPFDDGLQKTLLAFNAHQSTYDVVQFDNSWLAALAATDGLLPLDSYMADSTDFGLEDLPKPLQEIVQIGGKTYGANLSTEPLLLMYRTDIYKSLGLKVPGTLDEYLRNAQVVQDSGAATGQIVANATSQIGYWWLQFLWSFGGDLYGSDGTPAVDSPAAKAATEYMVDLLAVSPPSAKSANSDDAASIFANTDVGQMLNFAGYYPVVSDPSQSKVADHVGYAAVPAGVDNVTQVDGWDLGIAAASDKQALAWKYVDYLGGESSAKKFPELGAPAVGRRSVMSDAQLTKRYPYIAALPAAVQAARPLPRVAQWGALVTAIGTRVSGPVTQGGSVDPALASLAEDLAGIADDGS